eukprot:g1751.t1
MKSCHRSEDKDEAQPGRSPPSSFESSDLNMIESKALNREQIPGLDLMLKPIIDTVLTPITSQLISVITNEMGDNLSDALESATGVNIPTKTAMYVTAQVTYALNAFLVDSVTQKVTESMSLAAEETLAPSLFSTISTLMRSKLEHKLGAAVTDILFERVSTDAPRIIGRSLLASITEQITRSVTHAVVPALDHTLHLDADTIHRCEACWRSGGPCKECVLADSYQRNYYSSYYAGYYSDYYASYFASAARQYTGGDTKPPGLWPRRTQYPIVLEPKQ